MADADTMLINYNITVASGAARSYEEALKTVLDAANNDLAFFVHTGPCEVLYNII